MIDHAPRIRAKQQRQLCFALFFTIAFDVLALFIGLGLIFYFSFVYVHA